MRLLYHLWLSPFSRKVRLVLNEKKIPFEMKAEPVWERRQAFLALNPAGDVPVLVEPDGAAIADSAAICEYLEDTHPAPRLFGETAREGAEVRRLIAWFDRKFNAEVTEHLVGERIMKRFLGLGEPDSTALRAGKANLGYHLEYLVYLSERRRWLAGESLSLADLAAAAHLSTVDYLGDVPWDDYPEAKMWFARIKSRPSFRPLLQDYIPGAPPAAHYRDLDF
jgi:glutathione S-transferase